MRRMSGGAETRVGPAFMGWCRNFGGLLKDRKLMGFYLYYFPRAATTNYHTLGDFKQLKGIPTQFWWPDVQRKVLAGLCSAHRLQGEPFPASSCSRRLLVLLGLFQNNFCLQLHVYMRFFHYLSASEVTHFLLFLRY